MAVRGGLTRFAHPDGQPAHGVHGLSNGLRPLSNPGRGSSSPRHARYAKKKPVLAYELFLKDGGEGGLTRFARPDGQPAHGVRGLSNGLRPLSNPGRGSSSPLMENIKEKSRYISTGFHLNMAVRGGFEPPIRCRIHTFQACSFSHSDTSPYCCSSTTGTGANLGKYAACVNQLFQKIARLHKLQTTWSLIKRKLLFLPAPTNLLC